MLDFTKVCDYEKIYHSQILNEKGFISGMVKGVTLIFGLGQLQYPHLDPHNLH